MSASFFNATYVANPIRPLNANAPCPGSCFRIQVHAYFPIGVEPSVSINLADGPLKENHGRGPHGPPEGLGKHTVVIRHAPVVG